MVAAAEATVSQFYVFCICHGLFFAPVLMRGYTFRVVRIVYHLQSVFAGRSRLIENDGADRTGGGKLDGIARLYLTY